MDRQEAHDWLEMARQAAVGLVGPDAGTWQAQVRAAYDPLMHALDSYASRDDGEKVLEMATSLVRYWMAEKATEGSVVYDTVLTRHLTSSETRLREGLSAARDGGLSRLYPVALIGLGGVAAQRGDMRRAGSFIGSAERMLHASGQVLDPPDAWVLERITAGMPCRSPNRTTAGGASSQ